MRAIVIGLGNAGKTHCGVYRKAGFDVTGVDSDLPTLAAGVLACTTRCYATHEGLEADYLSICSYDRDHAAQVIWGLERDMNVFCEKPLCQDEKELRKIETVFRKSKGKLSCNLPLRFHPKFNHIKLDVSSGLIGKPYLIEADYQYGRLHKIINGWRGRDPFYSVVLGGGVHMVDLAQWMIGEKIIKVQAIGNNFNAPNIKTPDTVVAMGEFEGGCLFKMTCNFGFNGNHGYDFSIHGTEGRRFDYSRTPVKKDRPLVHFINTCEKGKDHSIATDSIFNGMRVCFAIDRAISLNVSTAVM